MVGPIIGFYACAYLTDGKHVSLTWFDLVPTVIYDWYIEGWRAVEKLAPATNVFSKEWDVLVLLDYACPEMLAEVADDYPYVASGETLTSVASCSSEWLEKTFDEHNCDRFAETAYITANPHTHDVDAVSAAVDLIEVWRTAWDDDTESIPPRNVTDTAIRYAREETWDRLIIHYMQPHPPFLDHTGESYGKVVRHDRQTDTLTFPEALLGGKMSPEKGWELHVENLRTVLDEVDLLRRNIDADRLIVSSDHGQAFGEWGIYGHPCRVPISALRTVPWEITRAQDDQTYSPADIRDRESTVETPVDEKLRALGYKE